MKHILKSYTPYFNPTAGTLDFSSYPGPGRFMADNVTGVINQTQNTAIYIPGVTGYGGTWSGSTLTLSYDTSTHITTDNLIVYYDDNAQNLNFAAERGGNLQTHSDYLALILLELRVQNYILLEGLNGVQLRREDIDSIRSTLRNGSEDTDDMTP